MTSLHYLHSINKMIKLACMVDQHEYTYIACYIEFTHTISPR